MPTACQAIAFQHASVQLKQASRNKGSLTSRLTVVCGLCRRHAQPGWVGASGTGAFTSTKTVGADLLGVDGCHQGP